MLGPYLCGLGKRKKSLNDTSTDEDVPENCEDFFSHRQETSLAKKRRINHLEAEVIPKFDPDKKTTNVKGWLNKIDQLGDMYSWDERDRIFVMQIRLRGAAREWYDDLEDYAVSWTQWKENLTRAFPRSTDYVDRLEEMLARTKDNKETMTRYFHDKMSLLKKCALEGEAATSCLIRGLPIELRANAYMQRLTVVSHPKNCTMAFYRRLKTTRRSRRKIRNKSLPGSGVRVCRRRASTAGGLAMNHGTAVSHAATSASVWGILLQHAGMLLVLLAARALEIDSHRKLSATLHRSDNLLLPLLIFCQMFIKNMLPLPEQ